LCYVFFVARRKPQNPVSDISKLVGGWLGGSGPGTNPTAARVQSQVKEAAKAADAALGGFGQAAVNDARRLSSGAGYVPSETIKAAAVNTAAAAAGYGAAKVAGAAGKAVAKTGVAQRSVRRVAAKDDIFIVHGSPTRNIKKIDPVYETMEDTIVSEPYFEERWPDGLDPSKAAIYGHNVTEKAGSSRLIPKKDLRNVIKDSVGYTQGEGSVYIARTPAKNWEGEASLSSAKVVREVKVDLGVLGDYEKSVNRAAKDVEKQLKALGFQYPKAPKAPKKGRGGGAKKR
jgi:virulence-associated protein VapD